MVASKKFLQLRDSNYHLNFRHLWQVFETPGSYLKKYRRNNGKNFEMVKMLCSRKSPGSQKIVKVASELPISPFTVKFLGFCFLLLRESRIWGLIFLYMLL